MSPGSCLVTHVIIAVISQHINMVTRASRSYWAIMVTMLLVHNTMAAVRIKRQVESFSGVGEAEEKQDDLLVSATNFIDELEENLLIALDSLIENQEAQDRVLLEDVQVIVKVNLF